LTGTAVVQGLKGRALTGNFVKLFGLLFIGTLATAITFAGIEGGTRTGAYTILGTIAGYLAGSRPQASKTAADGTSRGEQTLRGIRISKGPATATSQPQSLADDLLHHLVGAAADRA